MSKTYSSAYITNLALAEPSSAGNAHDVLKRIGVEV